jgi:tetratricopeptide (TPR) repeat protein
VSEAPQPPQGYRQIPEEDRRKAKTFFERGSTVAGTGQYDYAIEMFMQGLNIDPDSTEAHQTLREISFRRKASGGKAIGMLQAMKLKRGKDDKELMLNAEKLLAYDPGNVDHMVSFMTAAYKAGFYDSVLWVANIAHRANIDSGKPDIKVFMALKDHYRALSRPDLALNALQSAQQMRPDDADLMREIKELGAMNAMRQGKYESGGSFRDSIKDMDAQRKLLEADMDVRDADMMSRAIMDAEAEWRAQPEEPGKINKLVDALVKTENPQNENRAIDILTAAYEKTRQFRFRQSVGRIKMIQSNRTDRSFREKLSKNPTDEQLKADYNAFLGQKIQEELGEYTLWADAYPTDQSLKYEMAKRLFKLRRFDEAIPVLQSARQDAKIRVEATILLGRAFLEAEFVDEAVDTLKELIETYQVKGDSRSKEMTYWYARSLEARKEFPTAIKAYSQLAQWDFNYADVQKRIRALRASGGGAAPPAA